MGPSLQKAVFQVFPCHAAAREMVRDLLQSVFWVPAYSRAFSKQRMKSDKLIIDSIQDVIRPEGLRSPLKKVSQTPSIVLHEKTGKRGQMARIVLTLRLMAVGVYSNSPSVFAAPT